MPQTIATVLKLPEQPGRTHLDVLIGYVETKHVLLVLDNCEHLIDSCASLVEALLQRCSKLHVLATSRDRLRVPGEVTHHVPSLTTPDGAMPPDDLLRYEAVRLFRERAITSQSMFEWSASNAFAVAQICRRLDGIPLAIELATARLNVFTTEQIAERLTDRFNLLVTGSRTALRRHQTLRAAIAWSYDLLTEPEQTLLMRLSVFAGGFTAEAAEFVSGQPETLTLLSNLVDKSLVIAEVKGKTMRYRLLETIRQFANDLVSELGDVEEARDQHLKYFLQLAERAEPELRRADQIAWLDRLETELDNFRAAREWSLERERHVEAGLRLAAALLWLWHIRSRWREGSHWLERELLAEACTRGAKPQSEARTLARVQALNAAVFLIDNYAKRVALAEKALALSRKLGDAGKSSMAFALWNLADLAREQQKYSRVRMLSEESLALYREVGDKFGIAQCFYLLGYCALMTGDYERARALQEETLALRKEIGDIDGAAFAHYGLGQVAFGQGDFDLAAAIFEKCLALYDEVGSKRPVAWVLFALGSVARARGEYEQAVRQSEQALALAEETGDVYSIASSHHELGQTAWCQGDYGQAALQYEEALASFRELGDKSKTAEVLCGLGNVALVQGVQEQSAKQFEEALALGRDVGSTFTIADAVFGLGRVAQIRSDFASAEALHKEALALRHGTHDQWTISLSLDALAAVAVAQGQVRRAARLFGTAETSHELWRFTQSPFERDLYERAVAVVRSQLDESTLAAAWEEGQAMTMDQAVEYALSDEHNE